MAERMRKRKPAPFKKTQEGERAFAAYFGGRPKNKPFKINRRVMTVRLPRIDEEVIAVRVPRVNKSTMLFYKETARQSTKEWRSFLKKFIEDTTG